ncbi:ABC transporter ATP-binding protein [Liquorilactobacillus oeni]|uniref:ABC transporter ATP-binding protein n=1 Tax=Liquorilactobacillus oeni DSM 19972 TaxID=1423777 RepID=A0A0R1MBV4_9LACO|nr:ABC transporter ATP-binding protein [Liquorilactobacillus oeni]KRL05703.1 ABC transporter ATP-binding protein [Liquorilactobacillus oeni DSM 19972]
MGIELSNISKSYDNQNWTLKDVSVQIRSGEFFTIVGPSGCGKSTLLRMIAGLISISNGTLKIDGRDVTNLQPQERALTMVFQNYALFPFLDVKANVSFGLKARKMQSAQINERVANALELVGLSELKDRKPRELSGGQRQRVALARAIASDTKVCLMDEPLSNLDAQLRSKMRSEIRELQQKLGITLIYVTHDQVEAMTMADRIMVLHAHTVQQIGTPSEIYQHPANAFVAQFFGTPRMNLLSVHYASKNQRHLKFDSYIDYLLPRDIEDGDYFVGIRPGELEIHTADKANAVIKNIEYLGTQSIIHAVLDNDMEIRITTSKNNTFCLNDHVQIRATNTYFVFDSTGKAIFFNKGDVQNGYTDHKQEPANAL